MRVTRKAISIALLVLVASGAGVALRLAGTDDDPATTPTGAPAPTASDTRPLLTLGAGAAGSVPVALTAWRYRSDRADVGRRRGWAAGRFEGRAVTVPYSPNARHVTGPDAPRAFRGTVGWFTRTIDVPVAGTYAIAFGSAHHEATVYVDGAPVRRHVGAYEPFTARAKLTPGPHTVTVRVDWRDPERQTTTGYARGWFNFGGLNRPVTLARLGAGELGALTLGTRLRDGTAQVRVTARVRNRGAARRTITAQGTLSRDGAPPIALGFAPVTVSADASRTIRATVRIDDPALWSPADPQLYDLRLSVPGEASLNRRVGLRELRWDSGRLRLNGRVLRLHGAGLPADVKGRGDAWTAADEQQAVDALVASGANATRSQLPLSPTMLARLDAAGILLWQEIGPWETPAGFHSPTVAAARDRALRTAELEQAHPSVVAWTLTNEVLSSGRPKQIDYVVQTARELHRRDPTRPVAADLWGRHLTKVDGPLLRAVDALGVTDYTGWYEGPDLDARAQAAAVRARLDGLRRLFPDKPIVVTELGAAGTARIPGDGFGGLAFQAELLARRVRSLEQTPGLSGALVWLLRDSALRPDFRGGSVLDHHPGLDLAPGLNEKGLLDYAGRRKPSFSTVRRAFGTFAR